VAALVILLGAVLVYRIVGQQPKQVDFLIATDSEARKVNWSTRKEVIGSTWVVIGAMFLIAATLFVIDLAFQGAFTAIGVLER
jgi:preprotein translocase SecE subunit